jgi:TetR/AcrR family transcriptional regulator, fatty acid metabolism regulator protein
MGRTKKDVVTEYRTAEILQAASRVFAERGYEAATIAEIARQAGVGKGTVYLYYRSKRDVYWAALRHHVAELHALTTACLEAGTPVRDTVRAFVAVKLRYFEQHRDFFRIYYAEINRPMTRQAQLQRHVDEAYLEQVGALGAVLQQAVRSRAIRPVRTDAAAFAIFELTRGVVMQRLRGWSKATLDDDIAFAFDLTWKGIGQR